MTNLSMSQQAKQRIENLFAKLLRDPVDIDINHLDNAPKVEVNNVTTNSQTRLIVRTKLSELVKLLFEAQLSPETLKQRSQKLKAQVRDDLHLLERLGILEDNRIKTKGSAQWHFTLRIWHKDPLKNRTHFREFWEQAKSIGLNNLATSLASTSTQAPKISASQHPVHDWGNAPDIPAFYGRTQELSTLEQWIICDRCRLIAIVGMRGIGKTHLSLKLGKGGIGKTDLSLKVAKGIQHHFHFVIWRSLFNAPNLSELLGDLVRVLSNQHEVHLPVDLDQRISRLLHYLKQHQCLLILDNLESILTRGTHTENYRPGYEGYSQLLTKIATTPHQSCVLLTSREDPNNLATLHGKHKPVRFLHLEGLDILSGQKIFESIGDFIGSPQEWQTLIQFYNGNPLALELAAHYIEKVFHGDISQFLKVGKPIFDNLRELLDWHFERLTDYEQEILYWLAINREPISVQSLQADVVSPLAIAQLPQTIMSLQRSFPLERGSTGFTLQPVLMEYVIAQLIEKAYQAIVNINLASPELDYLHHYALIKATAKDYIRQSQQHLITQPILDKLLERFTTVQLVENYLSQYLNTLRNQQFPHFSYAAGNSINLLCQLQVDLSSKDFSHLTLRQAYLQGANLQGCDFSHSHFYQTVFTQSFNSLRSIAFSPDGITLAFGDTFGDIYIWDITSGEQKWVFQDHKSWVQSLIYSQDGTTLASGSMDHTIKLWSLESGQCITTLSGHNLGVWSIAFNSDASMLASGSLDHTVKLWDIKTRHCFKTLMGHSNQVNAVAIHPNEHILASGGADNSIKLWDLETGQCQATFIEHQNDIWSLDFNPDGTLLASGSADRTIKLWDLNTQVCSQTLVRGAGDVYSVIFSLCGEKLASANQDATVRIWDLTTGDCIQTFQHTSWAWSVAFSPDGYRLATASDDQIVRLWDVATGQCLSVLASYAEIIRGITFLPLTHDWGYQSLSKIPSNKSLCKATESDFQIPNYWLASAGDASTIRIWNLKTSEFHTFGESDSATFGCLSIRDDGKYIAGGRVGAVGTVLIWQLGQEQKLHHRFSHPGWIMALAFAPHRQILASGSFNKEIKIWDIDLGDCLHTLTDHQDGIWSVAFSPDGCLFASASLDGTIKIWDADNFNCINTLTEHQAGVRYIEFSTDSQYLISTSMDQTIKIWDTQTQQCLKTLQGHKSVVWVASLSPNAQRLVSGSFDGNIKLWDIQTSECVASINAHKGIVWGMKYSPDGKIIASCSEDETIRLWDIDMQRCLKVITMPRPYDGMNITNTTGLTQSQKSSLRALGAL